MVCKGLVVQSATTLILSMVNFCGGYGTVWPSYSLRYFEEHPERFGGTYQPHHGDMIGSVSMLSSFIAIIFGGTLADFVGRKKGEMICGLCFLLSGALTSTANSINLILAARFLVGLGIGLQRCIHSLFISEYTEDSTRGIMMTATTTAYTSGILVSYIVGWLCSYDVVNYFMISLALVFLVAMSFLKETPAYLLSYGRDTEALESLKFYRGTNESSRKILDELSSIKYLIQPPDETANLTEKQYLQIKDSEKEKLRLEMEEMCNPKTKCNPWQAFRSSKSSQRALVISTLLLLLLVFMGMIAVQTYAGSMFLRAVPSLSPDLCSVLLAVFNMLGCSAPMLLSNYLGRRIMMITSCVLVSICLFTIGALLRWSIGPVWMVPVMSLAYCFCFQIGIGCVPFVFISECFLPEVKTLGNTISLCTMEFSNFILLAVFRPMVELIGLDGAYFVFAGIAVANTCFCYVCLPETAGLSTEAIQALFRRGYVQIRRPKPAELSESEINLLS